MRRKCLVGAVVGACFAVGAASANAATLYVSNTVPVKGSGKNCSEPGYSSVRSAISVAASGSTIDICSGIYTEQLEIEKALKLNAVNGAGTATVAMPETPSLSTSGCDTAALEGGGHLEQWDEISICTPATVTITNLKVEAEAKIETCANGLYGLFVGDGGTLKAKDDTIVGASTTNSAYLGCQHGVAIEVGYQNFYPPLLATAEIGHAQLTGDSISGYQKNGPTAATAGSTLIVQNSTITGVGESPYIAQNGIQVGLGAKGTISGSSVAGNECNVASCGAHGEQASGLLFYGAAAGSKVESSAVKENDLGVYYSSGSSVEPSSPQLTLSKDVLTGNRYEGVLLEEGKALLSKLTIGGPGRAGIDLYQASYQQSASESRAIDSKIEGQSEAGIIVESDKEPSDIAGKFTFASGTITGNRVVLINESNNFEVIF